MKEEKLKPFTDKEELKCIKACNKIEKQFDKNEEAQVDVSGYTNIEIYLTISFGDGSEEEITLDRKTFKEN